MSHRAIEQKSDAECCPVEAIIGIIFIASFLAVSAYSVFLFSTSATRILSFLPF